MTPDQAASLTAHLAEKVCGWPRVDADPPSWCIMPGGFYRDDFAPFTDPRDTALVMDAWNNGDDTRQLVISTNTGRRGQWVVWAAEHRNSRQYTAEVRGTWTEAVCEAIGRASGWEGK